MRSAIVTGCSSGIGLSITEMLLAEGWEVLGISRTMSENPSGWDYGNWSWIEWDLGQDPADYEPPPPGYMTGPSEGYHPSNVLRDDQDKYDALIHCAGIRGPFGPMIENDEAAWIQTIQTNLIGTYRVARAALPLLQRSQDGRILLFSGGGAFSPEPNFSAYAATKGATVALMETLAEELHGSVTVNCVAPGFVATPIHNGTPHEHREAAPDAMVNVVACVQHLLSPHTQGLTGRTIAAQWDDWQSIDQTNVAALQASEMGTRDRHRIQCVRSLVRPKQLVGIG